MGTQLPLPKKGDTAPNFRTMSIVPKRPDGSRCPWYGGRPRPRPHCARWGPSSPSPKKGHSPQFSAHVYCAQTAGCIKMPLGTKIGLGPGHIVLQGDPASPRIRGTAPKIFGLCLLWPNDRPSQLLLSTCPLAYKNVHISSLSLAKVVRALFMG